MTETFAHGSTQAAAQIRRRSLAAPCPAVVGPEIRGARALHPLDARRGRDCDNKFGRWPE